MDRSSPNDVLPSYTRYYYKHDFTKVARKGYDEKETAFADIREKIKSAVIAVPYQRGVDNLKLHRNFSRKTSPTEKNKNNGHDLVETNSLSPSTTPRSYVGSEAGSTTATITSIRSHKSTNNSPSRVSDRSKISNKYITKLPKIGRERATSATSTTSTWSRPYSLSTNETDDSYWRRNVREIEDLKERYSENSEFMNSIYSFLEDEERKIRQKRQIFLKLRVKHKSKSEESKRDQDDLKNETTSAEHSDPKVQVLGKHSKTKSSGEKRVKSRRGVQHKNDHTHDEKLHLPRFGVHEEDGRITATSRETPVSRTDRSQSAYSVDSRKTTNSETKQRKVEFNLLSKRRMVLPHLKPVTSKHSHKPLNPKSILKTQREYEHKHLDKLQREAYKRLAKESYKESIDGKGDLANGRDTSLPRMSSPMPISGSRRNQTVFQRKTLNFLFKCSKEFQTAMGDIGE